MQDIEFEARISRWRSDIKRLAADMDSTTTPDNRGIPFDKGPLLSAFEKSVLRLEKARQKASRKQSPKRR